MMNDHERQLIQSFVDGELDAAGEQEARALLEASSEARALREDLRELGQWLDQAPIQEPPAELHEKIIRAVRLPSARAANGPSWTWLSGLFRYGLTAAAGVALTLAVLQLPLRGTAPGPEFGDRLSMVGSMVGGNGQAERPAEPGEILDRLEIGDGGAAMEARLDRVDGLFRVELELRSESPVDFTVDWSATGLELAGLVPGGGDFRSLRWDQDRLLARTDGPRRLSLVLAVADDRPGADGSRIELALLTGESALVSGRLEFED